MSLQGKRVNKPTRRARLFANLRVGKAMVKAWWPSHVAGVHEGNHPQRYRRSVGMKPKGEGLVAVARRSTGVNPRKHNAIDPQMPNLYPP